jgi:glycine/D-amino acid oxidase-like deaminating enzyme
VIGAGIVGCATTWELARRGVNVCLVERAAQLSAGTTGVGEGNVLCCDKEPGAELDLALAGLRSYDEIHDLLGDEAGIQRKGALVIHTEEPAWEAESRRLEQMRAAGVDCERMAPESVREEEPELQGPILGASWFPDDLQCDPRAVSRGLARHAEGAGAKVVNGLVAEAIAVDGKRVQGVAAVGFAARVTAENVVLAAGTWSAPLAATVGLRLPVEPRKGQVVRLERRPEFLRHKVIEGSYMAAVANPGEGLVMSTVMETTLDGHVLVGSSRERRGFDVRVDPGVSASLIERAARFAPGIRDLRVDAAWAGLRPWLPDGLPAIGRSAVVDGLWVATGHEGAGVAHGPITGRLIAQAICGEQTALALGPFDPDRFNRG